MRSLPLLLLPAALWAGAAHAQHVNRCTDPQGRTVYGDKPCEAMGARPRLLPEARPAGASGLYRDSCARRLSEVVAQIRAAVEARDPNHLSGIYAWSGLSSTEATRVMDRLDAIVQRPLVDIAPVFPRDPELLPEGEGEGDGDGDGEHAGGDAAAMSTEMPARRPRPVALRLEQPLGQGATPSRTLLKLRRQYNCFWISL